MNAAAVLGLIMLNPSTADSRKDDPTISAVIKMAQRWGFGWVAIGNLFAWRSSTVVGLDKAVQAGVAVGIENDVYLRQLIGECDVLMVGWGSHGAKYIDRVRQVDHLIHHLRRSPKCIGTTTNGHPKHPLLRFHTAKQKAEAELQRWVCP
jgi:hypothetical protein